MMLAVLPLTNHNEEHDFREILEPEVRQYNKKLRRMTFNNTYASHTSGYLGMRIRLCEQAGLGHCHILN